MGASKVMLALLVAGSMLTAVGGIVVGNRAVQCAEAFKGRAIAWHDRAQELQRRLDASQAVRAELETKLNEAQKGLTKEQRRILATHVAGRPGTLAYKNKNPLNIKHLGKQKWLGEVGRDYLGHVQFSSIHYGLRAAVMTLYSYETRHGVKDLATLINRFCGGNEDYVTFLSRNMDLKPDEKFSITKRMPELIKLMSLYESGHEVKQEVIATLDILKRM